MEDAGKWVETVEGCFLNDLLVECRLEQLSDVLKVKKSNPFGILLLAHAKINDSVDVDGVKAVSLQLELCVLLLRYAEL